MKNKTVKIIFIALFLSSASSLFASISLGAAVDVSSAWVRPISIEADLRADFNYNLRFRLGVQYDRGNIKDLIILSPNLDYSPFGKNVGLFLGVAPVDVAFLIAPNNVKPKVFIMNAVSLGIKQSLFSDFVFIELRLTIRDPTTICKNNFNEIKRYITDYSRFKFRLCIGFNFDVIKNDSKNNTTVTKTTTTKIVETTGGSKTTKTTETKSSPKKSTSGAKKKTSSSSKSEGS